MFQPVERRANYTIYQQRPNYSQTYRGVELFLNKRFAKRWMANASFVYGDNVNNYEGTGGFTNPTNVARENSRSALMGSRFGSWGNARWNLKASGMVQLPAGFSVAGFVQAREGGINIQNVRSNRLANGGGFINVWVEDVGETRLPTIFTADLRAEKSFDIRGRGRIHLILDAFNVTNSDTILGQEGRLNSSRYGLITDVLQGRVIRLGVRLVVR